MELRDYFALLRRWWWLCVLCALLGGGGAYLVSSQTERVYQASTLLMVGRSVEMVNPTQYDMMTSEMLAQTYAELVQTRPILDATVDALSLPGYPAVSVSLVRDTQLMRIFVEDSIPARAAATADELARQLILQSPTGSQRQAEVYREFVDSQLLELQQEITTLSQAVLNAREMGSDRELIARLEGQLGELRANYSTLLEYVKDTSTNYIRVIEPAEVPLFPIKPRIRQNTLLAAVVGLVLALGVAFLVEYLDDTVKGQADLEEILQVPALGSVVQLSSNGSVPQVVTMAHPSSSLAESYRLLRASVRYSLPMSTTHRMFMVTSIEPNMTNATLITNLAVVTAQAGQKTILVDADLRRPNLHKYWNCPNALGLTSFLVGEVHSVHDILVSTSVPNLQLVTSGPIPPNAPELISSPRMREFLESIAQQADVVLIDSPPLLMVSDASILAGQVNGTILVAQAGRTRLEACAQAVEAIKKVGGTFLGVVLNHVSSPRKSR